MPDFCMPSLGADMDEGTLVEWLVKPGDVVHRGDVIAVVDTVKTAMDIEVFTDGVIERLLVEPGTTLPVGAVMAVIGDGAAPATTTPAEPAEPAAPAEPAEAAEPAEPRVESPLVRRLAAERGVAIDHVTGTGPDGLVTRADVEAAAPAPAPAAEPVTPAATVTPPRQRTAPGVRAVPRARRRAAELGIDLATIAGTGPAGAVTDADVDRAALARGPASVVTATEPAPTSGTPATEAADPRTPLQVAVGELMARSKREIPHFYLSTSIDLAATSRWLAERNAGRAVEDRLVPAAVLLKATALAARRSPEVNGFWVDGTFRPAAQVHLGVAISLRSGGLVAPAIHDADALSLDELMQRLRDVVARARSGHLRQSEMADPTLTVTNLGEQGVAEVYGVVYPPQVALVGFGRVADRPVAVDGMLAVRPVVTATLCADHRVSDGHRGGRFLTTIERLLQQPEEL